MVLLALPITGVAWIVTAVLRFEWQERAGGQLRHRRGRDCAGRWREVGQGYIACSRCGARHEMYGAAYGPYQTDREMGWALRALTAAGREELERERAS